MKESGVCPHTVICCYKILEPNPEFGLKDELAATCNFQKIQFNIMHQKEQKEVKQAKIKPDGSLWFVCNVMRIPS